MKAWRVTALKSQKPNHLHHLAERRYSRRQFLRDGALVFGGLSLAPTLGCLTSNPLPSQPPSSEKKSALELFGPVDGSIIDGLHLPPGYQAEVVIAWGDPLTNSAPPFDWRSQTASSQCGQFGYNCDYVGYLPLEPTEDCVERGLLCVNHEYSVGSMMFEGYKDRRDAIERVSEIEAQTEAASIGHSVVEIQRTAKGWHYVQSAYNRRITLFDTPLTISGPAAGHSRLKTKHDPSGTRVIGTLANCSGGTTPWGTVLFCEENINDYFSGPLSDQDEPLEGLNYKRYRMDNQPRYPFHRFDERFQIGLNPNEPNRFGWVVEYDPKKPDSTPVKRTSLGRFMREAATVVHNDTGHIVIYSGDDNYFEYMYKWVSHGTFSHDDPNPNPDFLDHGDLYVARCEDDGTLNWLLLKFGQGDLTPQQGFHSQADVLIETRRAADLLGGTRMDRPEDVETNPRTGKVYAMLTKNKHREAATCDGPNPRPGNHAGHILEMIPPLTDGTRDHTSTAFRWEIFALGGVQNENDAADADTLANPDNATFDRFGRLWITSDGTQDTIGTADGVWVCETEGPDRAKMKRFASVPIGAEATGPCFTPDESTFFLAVQHPGHTRNSSLETTPSRWPHGDTERPPRPAVVAIRRIDGKPITS